MDTPRHILIALEESDASMQAVDHVARQVTGKADVTVRLLHIVGPLPTELLEHGGASDPDELAARGQRILERQQRWIRETCEAFLSVFARARERLLAAGLAPRQIVTQCSESIPEDNLAQLILDDARAAGCDTIVVGRNAYTWFGERFHRHVGDLLQKHAGDARVEVVA